MGLPTVAGHCPACGGTSLFLAAGSTATGGYVTCSRSDCPRPDAAATLLDDAETEHIVAFGQATFTLRHPLRERLDDALMECALHAHIAALSGPPVRPGRYRARVHPVCGWSWEPLTTKRES